MLFPVLPHLSSVQLKQTLEGLGLLQFLPTYFSQNTSANTADGPFVRTLHLRKSDRLRLHANSCRWSASEKGSDTEQKLAVGFTTVFVAG